MPREDQEFIVIFLVIVAFTMTFIIGIIWFTKTSEKIYEIHQCMVQEHPNEFCQAVLKKALESK